ncbi:MAG: phosphoribosylamine--glycine ligase [Sandaracinaceae bacterium]|nr:phosphoribosylamine--glycine ligase [Sandaracinaceae bacterium]
MKVLVVGGGAREHALAGKLARSPRVTEVLVAPGNAGTAEVATNLPIAAGDLDALVRAAREHAVGLVVVGPEAPLVAGLVDALEAAGVPTFGPSASAARLEGSKGFAKDFMARHGIPTAAYRVFDDAAQAAAWVRELDRPMVVKADGLAAGKGVVVAATVDETLAALDSILLAREHGDAGARVVVEERLEGPEISFHVVCDGVRTVPLAAAQDHKRLRDGDRGPNTGGMGAYSPPPMVDAALERAILERVVEPTLRGMAAEGAPFRGVLFVGLMLVGGEPRVLEYNVRFGDPETSVLMARLDGDILPLLLGAARGDLGGVEVRWGAPAALSVVVASEGYPGACPEGRAIEGLARAAALDGVTVYHAGTRREGERVIASGGRVLCVTARGESVPDAAARAYAAVDAITLEGAQHRRDIGWQAR